MAGKRGVRVIILGEDHRQVSFVRRVLMLLGFDRRNLFARPVPDGKGAGECWVRNDYPKQVALQRSKGSYQQGLSLVVSIDADKKSIGERRQQLDKAVKDNQMDKRGKDEPIAIWTPNRNIETWFKYFAGEDVDEETDYKLKVKKPNLKQAAEGFVGEFRRFQNDPYRVQTLPSLLAAYEDTIRLL